jgi:hypothetical protein
MYLAAAAVEIPAHYAPAHFLSSKLHLLLHLVSPLFDHLAAVKDLDRDLPIMSHDGI